MFIAVSVGNCHSILERILPPFMAPPIVLYSLLMSYKSLSVFILQSDQVNNRLQSDLNETKRKLEKAQDEIKEKMKLETNLLLAQSVSVQCD